MTSIYITIQKKIQSSLLREIIEWGLRQELHPAMRCAEKGFGKILFVPALLEQKLNQRAVELRCSRNALIAEMILHYWR